MGLTEEEKKMVAWLRRQHKNWKSTRVIILICSVMIIGISIYFYLKGENGWHLIPLFITAVYCLSYSLGSWSGRPEIFLLLKIVDKDEDAL